MRWLGKLSKRHVVVREEIVRQQAKGKERSTRTLNTHTRTHTPWPRHNALFIRLLDETVAASATDLLRHVAKLLTSCRSFTRVPVCTRTHVSKKDVDQYGECVLNNIQLHCSLFLRLRMRNKWKHRVSVSRLYKA